MIIDLKTTSNIKDFRYSARKYNYDSQAYIYSQLFGKPLVFYVVDKINLQLGIFTPTQDFIDRGQQKVEMAVDVYNRYFKEGCEHSIEDFVVRETL